MSGYEMRNLPSQYATPQGQGGQQQLPDASPPQGQYVSSQPHSSNYSAPPQQPWGDAPPQGPRGGPEMRHSVSFNFSGTRKTILNSQVTDSYGKVPFNVVSDKKHTTVRTSNGTTLAVVEWNHWTPVMHYGGKQLKCKEWIVLHKSKRYVWLTRSTYPSLPTSPADLL